MPIYGLLTMKSSIRNASFNNRYYVSASTLEGAISIGEDIVEAERQMFGTGVTFHNIHVWLPSSSPRSYLNHEISLGGIISAANPIKSEIVVRVTWGAESANPPYKNYRVQVDADRLSGDQWSGAQQSAIIDTVEALDDLFSVLKTRTGGSLGNPSFDAEYQFQQVGKTWYNRTV